VGGKAVKATDEIVGVTIGVIVALVCTALRRKNPVAHPGSV